MDSYGFNKNLVGGDWNHGNWIDWNQKRKREYHLSSHLTKSMIFQRGR